MANAVKEPTSERRSYDPADLRLGPGGHLAVASMVVMAIIYPPLILTLAAGLVWLAIWLMSVGFVHSIYLFGTALFAALIALALVASLLTLMMRLGEQSPDGMFLKPTHEPAVFAIVERVSKRLGVAPPSRILLTPGFDAAITRARFKDDASGVTHEHVLILGIQDILNSSTAELAATICHEIAHAASGDTLGGRTSFRFMCAMASAAGIHNEDGNWITWIVHLPIVGYLKLYLILYLYTSRQREYRADRAAARICGPQTTRDMLRKTHRVHGVPELSLDEVTRHAGLMFPRPRNLYDVFRARLEATTEKRWAQAENEMFLEPRTLWSTHPNLADRFRALAEIDASELAGDRPAWKIFREWERSELMHSAELYSFLDLYQKAEDRALDRIVRR